MKYLFIGGAPRSGTSALTELVSSHPDVALGMERYKYLYKNGLVEPSHFSSENFFDFKEQETNINSSEGKYVDYYSTMREKYASCTVLGDKYPLLYKYIPKLMQNFGSAAKFVLIVRKIEDVASSFNVRAMNPNDSWPEENNYESAVIHWNSSIECAIKALETKAPLLTIKYEELFDQECFDVHSSRKTLSNYLEIDDDKQFESSHLEMCEKYSKAVKNKDKTVGESQVQYIQEHANFDSLVKLERLASM